MQGELVFFVLVRTTWQYVDPTIHTDCRGCDVDAQMTKHGVICGAKCKRACHCSTNLVYLNKHNEILQKQYIYTLHVYKNTYLFTAVTESNN